MGFLCSILHKKKKSSILSGERTNFIFYKIIEFSEADQQYILQCINKNSLFYLNLERLVMDVDILYGLHPIQACFIGIAYTQSHENSQASVPLDDRSEKKLNKYQQSRYGKYRLSYQRQKSISFICKETNEEFTMDARDISLSHDLIGEFDAMESFIIGQEAGRQLMSSRKQAITSHTSTSQRSYLKLVK